MVMLASVPEGSRYEKPRIMIGVRIGMKVIVQAGKRKRFSRVHGGGREKTL
jgi:hypothetical protein